ncbi:hypothetical protein B0F90DRAFT_1730059 [Multifurca ochricompacta]|uniref:Conserved oligomeric Golgi complex subunit 7 n=1 Tax=Multifurca ochricompacta TaxID=376703 RepID=A0AAD4M481_9AGAM|nr:hypothetical protein B0F90DRAFT_1730059 [Multifurca ochricompacta]
MSLGDIHTRQPDFLLSLDNINDNDNDDDNGDNGIVSWINNLLQHDEHNESSNLASLEKHLNHIVPALEIASEDLSLHIERLIDEISRSASRLPYDLHFMRDGALSVQLHSLDIIKRNMESAQSWSTLESEVSSLLSEQNYEKAAEKLSEANKSMIYEARRTLMVSLQNQLEASLSSALIAAINNHDLALCRNYYSIFGNIQRESEFRAYYFGSRRNAKISDVGDPSVSPPVIGQSTSDFLNAFFNNFLGVLGSEHPQITLSTFITSTLSTLQPTFTERLSALCNHYGPAALPELITIFQAAERFAVGADKILERTEATSSLLSQPSDSTNPDSVPKSYRRRSSHGRLSISRRMSLSISATGSLPLTGSGLDWDIEVYEPFLEYQVSYATLEAKFLSSSLPDSPSQMDPVREFRERTLDSLSRMHAFTHGYGAAALVSSLDQFLKAFIDGSRASFASSTPASAASDLADLDYTLEDYSAIQAWLHLLESLRGLRDRLTVFESQLRGTLLQVSTAFRSRAQDPHASVPSTTRGALQLLSESTLNTAPLHDLLDSIHLQDGRVPNQESGRVRGSSLLLARARSALDYAASLVQTSLQAAIQGPRRTGGAGATSDAAVPTFSLSPKSLTESATAESSASMHARRASTTRPPPNSVPPHRSSQRQ